MTADIYWIWLCTLPGIGPVRAHKLLELFGDPQRIYHTEKVTFLQHGLKDTDWLQTILEEKNLDTAKRIYDNCLNHDILLLTIYDQPYPQALRAIPELPVLLYYKGKLKSDIRGMGIVGADVCYPSEHRGLIAAWSKELYVIGAGRNSGTRYTLDYYNKYHQKKGVILEREQ